MRFPAVSTTGDADCEEFRQPANDFIDSEHVSLIKFADIHFFAAAVAAAVLIFVTHSLLRLLHVESDWLILNRRFCQ